MGGKVNLGTENFQRRYSLTRCFEEMLEKIFEQYNLKLLKFGQNTILKGNVEMLDKLKNIGNKSNPAALMMKFSPDYIVYKKDLPEALFFLDAKASITPIYFGAQIERIKNNSKETGLTRSNVGEIEREAWFTYNTFYPPGEVAIVLAAPYNTRVILGEWVKNIKCLWCYKINNGRTEPWDCGKCPLRNKDNSFGVDVNLLADGSGTPHTNIDFRSMRTLSQFMKDEFGVITDSSYENMLTQIKKWQLKRVGRVNQEQYDKAIMELRREGCNWL